MCYPTFKMGNVKYRILYIGLDAKYPFSGQIVMELDFFDRFSKNTQISNSMNIRQVGTEFFHADGRTELITTCHNYANSPKHDGLIANSGYSAIVTYSDSKVPYPHPF